MGKKSVALDMLIAAMLKLGTSHAERENVIAFIRSCYCGRVLNYDLDAALAALAQLSAEEQHGLIVWAMMNEEASQQRKLRASA